MAAVLGACAEEMGESARAESRKSSLAGEVAPSTCAFSGTLGMELDVEAKPAALPGWPWLGLGRGGGAHLECACACCCWDAKRCDRGFVVLGRAWGAGAAAFDVCLRASGSVLEDARVGDEGLVFVTWRTEKRGKT